MMSQKILKKGSVKVANWILKMCNKAFESGVVLEDCRSVMIAPLYKGKGKMVECSNYRGINLLSMVGKIYAGILLDRVHKVTMG